jgi:hypothetical protein
LSEGQQFLEQKYMNNNTQFTATKNGSIIEGTASDTEKGCWKLIGAKNSVDRLMLKALGFNVIVSVPDGMFDLNEENFPLTSPESSPTLSLVS